MTIVPAPRLALMLALSAFAACSAQPPPPEARPATTVQAASIPDGSRVPTQITSANGDGCMDVPPRHDGSDFWGTVQQFPCNSGNNQDWWVQQLGDGTSVIHPWSDASYCLDIPSGDVHMHQQVNVYRCNGGLNQRWVLFPVGNGATMIETVLHDPSTDIGLCLDVPGAVADQQVNLQLYPCNGGGNQHWKYARWLHTQNGQWSCNGTVRFTTATGERWIGPGEVGVFASVDNYSSELCSDGPFNENSIECDSGTNWMVIDRRAGNDVTVVCYQK